MVELSYIQSSNFELPVYTSEKLKRGMEDLDVMTAEARKHVWMGAIPLSITLHSSEVTSLPAPSPFLVLASRYGYLPLLADVIRPHFQGSLPPGTDMIWFDYAGLPLKWHIPTGVLFDLLCSEPERPWNLTVHFRAYPLELLSPCESEETVKWNFINAMKEASYIMYGNTKSVMNMSQLDQFELWKSVVKGDLANFDHISARLKPTSGTDPARIPLRIYVRKLKSTIGDLFDVPPVNSWDELVYMTRPADFRKEGFIFTLGDALMKVVPHLFSSPLLRLEEETDPCCTSLDIEVGDVEIQRSLFDRAEGTGMADESEVPTSVVPEFTDVPANTETEGLGQDGLAKGVHLDSGDVSRIPITKSGGEGKKDRMKSCGGLWEDLHLGSAQQFNGVVRIQGIEPNLDIPLDWVARNLCGPEQFVHLSISTWGSL